MRSVFCGLVLAALAVNPCIAKDHAQHGVRAGAANAASGKGASGANPVPSKNNIPIDKETIVAPPVLLPQRVTHQQFRIVSPSVKRVGLGNPSRNSSATVPVPIARNAIGQAVAPAKNPARVQSPGVAPQRAVASPSIPARAAALSVSPAAARVNLANATNRGGINGATLVRPAAGPSLVGGPAQVRYGINGTTVQNKH